MGCFLILIAKAVFSRPIYFIPKYLIMCNIYVDNLRT
ncbi:MAG: hypothetical protein MjAS7_1156 [Metallosphaera javensis (ex Sakai et al. 2022)]|nr:MAG: hypothetical protein MjAS7_1156 [Metallosphaera javensis (ex Sakai et al. 2022)]